jgi:hypothetical protein
MRAGMIGIGGLIVLSACLQSSFITTSRAQTSFADIPGIDMTNSYTIVLDRETILMRNMRIFGGGPAFYRAKFKWNQSAWRMDPASLRLEGTKQRAYVIQTRSITIDGSKADWDGIPPAFLDPEGDSTGPPGSDIKALYLAKDDTFLYVLMTLYGPPIADGHGMYFFQARTIPEDDLYDFYSAATPLFGGLGPVNMSLHFRPQITRLPSGVPWTTTFAYFAGYVGQGYDSATREGFVEWKVPFSSFPRKALVGKYIDAWTGTPPNPPSRLDSTDSEQGVRIELGP